MKRFSRLWFGIASGLVLLGAISLSLPLRSSAGVDPTLPPSGPPPIVTWIRQNAIRLKTVEPESGFKDMNPVERLVSSARIVAMGEATHGSREFFRIKHRMLEFLVERMGFTVFGIEANWSECLPINGYVVDGIGEPAQLLAGTRFWTWKTEEVLELIRWMRAYNQNPRHIVKVKFSGFDMQRVAPAASAVGTYLMRADRDYAMGIEATLTDLRRSESLAGPEEWDKVMEKAETPVEKLESRLQEKRRSYVARSGEKAWREASGHARILREAVQMYSAGRKGDLSLRDRFLAENVEWIRNEGGPKTRMMLWAHNGHISLSGGSMGSQLRKSGVDLVAVGFVFNQGSFRASDRTAVGHRSGELRTFALGPAPAESLDAILAAAGIPLFLLDLRRASEPAAGWFRSVRLTRDIGAFYSDESSAPHRIVPAEDYDILLFVDRVTAVRPLQAPAGVPPRSRELPLHKTPVEKGG